MIHALVTARQGPAHLDKTLTPNPASITNAACCLRVLVLQDGCNPLQTSAVETASNSLPGGSRTPEAALDTVLHSLLLMCHFMVLPYLQRLLKRVPKA
jgi:hypothetical protein